MKSMRLSFLLIAVAAALAVQAATQNPTQPDFAYPETVITNATKALKAVEKAGDDRALVTAVLQVSTARAVIGSDSLYTVPAWIDSYISHAKHPAAKSLLNIIEALAYKGIYSQNRWKYSHVKQPLYPYPADVAAWSEEQFCRRIDSLLLTAYDLAKQQPQPLDQWSGIITANKLALQYYPTVRDFAALQLGKTGESYIGYDFDSVCDSVMDEEIACFEAGTAPWCQWTSERYRYHHMPRSFYLDLYRQYSDRAGARQFLIKYLDDTNLPDATPADIALAEQSLAQFPTYWDNNSLRNRIAELKNPSIKVSAVSTVATGRPMTIKVEYANIKGKGGIIVYRGPSNSVYTESMTKAPRTEVARFTVQSRDTLPYQTDETFTFTPTDDAHYIIKPFIKGVKSQAHQEISVLSTSLTPILLSNNNDMAVFVASSTDGRPVQNVNVTAANAKNPYSTIALGKTDDEGTLHFKYPASIFEKSERWGFITLQQGKTKHVYNRRISFSKPYSHTGATSRSATIFTDRALYHPGDSISWAAVVTCGDNGNSTQATAKGQQFNVCLYNANYETVVDTLMTSDGLGRLNGRFATPADGLTGRYRIELRYDNSYIGATAVTVSDFKLPTFRVEVDSVDRNLPQPGWVTLSGRAMTYSMMPVTDAKVTAQIFAASRSRWLTPDELLGVVSGVTDSDGEFTIELPDTLLSRYRPGCYSATVTITSTAGESQQADRTFVTGKPLEIIASSQTNIDTDHPTQLPVNIYDATGNITEPAVSWSIHLKAETQADDDYDDVDVYSLTDDTATSGTAVASGRLEAGKYGVNWGSIPSGRYILKVATADPALADTCSMNITLYNSRLGTMPAGEPIFVPNTTVNIRHGSDSELLYGVPTDTYLYMALAADTTLVSVEGLETSAGFHRLRLTLPEGCERGILTIYAVSDAMVTSRTVNIYEPVDRGLAVETESFRDRITPGSSETWHFRLRAPGSVGGTQGAMIATAYNKALDALQTCAWASSFHYPVSRPNLNHRTVSNYYESAQLYGNYKSLNTTSLKVPEWKYNPGNPYEARIYNSLQRRTAGVNIYGDAYLDATASYASPVMAKMEAADIVDEMKAEAEPDAGTDDGTDSGGDRAPSGSDDFEYRDGEVLQALWQPSLVTDGEGNIDLTFTVPNANGSWHLQAFVWDQLMNSGSLSRDFVTSKPVMVQPNLPRFLRAGDSARLLASVYNNSDEADSVSTVIETFDLASGMILSQNSRHDFIAANGSAVIPLEVAAPADASAVGFRVRSTMGRFTDGEQSALPVLPATDRVMDSEIFVMQPGKESAAITLPKGNGMQLVLQYCANPAWDVIKALPALCQANLTTATQASLQLYRAAASAGLVNSDPAISAMLRKVLNAPGDSSLVSQLSKNDELKQSTLQQTPWVQAAAGQTQQMASLALLFDSKAVNADINAAIKLLDKLQNADGGWSWGEWSSKSSRWTTASVLNTLGLLNATGMLPADKRLKSMTERGMQYMQNSFQPRQTTDRTFTILCYYFPDFRPSVRGQQIVDATVQSLISGWRSENVAGKASDALLLKHYGYARVAAEIVSSIEQFAVTDAAGSISFPSVKEAGDYAPILFAYAGLRPDSPMVDGMRQWLVMRSQYNYGLAADNVTMLIAAYLRSGTRWTVPPTKPQVLLGNEPVQLPAGELMTGFVTTRLDNSSGNRRLTISRDDMSVPAWGAVLACYTARIDKIKAASCKQLSIDKELSVLRDGQWVYADNVQLGEQVRVILTIKAQDDLSYVTVVDDRPAGFEPVDQLPGYDRSGGASFYRESGNSATRFFIDYLPRGTYRLSYLTTASTAGDFLSGVATVQSQYAPSATAHSSGRRLTVN